MQDASDACLYWVPFPGHTAAGWATEPAEIKQQATSARNLQQIERREQNKPLSHLIPPFSLPFSLSIRARKPFRDYIRNQRGFYRERTDPAGAFWTLALLFDRKVVSHEREEEVEYPIACALKFSEKFLAMKIDVIYSTPLHIGIAVSMYCGGYKEQDYA